MDKDNKLKGLIDWAGGEEGRFREFSSVLEVHFFLLGYQVSESHNEYRNGHGNWISDFMIFCEKETSQDKKRDECAAGVYYSYIMITQKNDLDGLKIFYALYDKFIKTRSETAI